MSLCETIIIYFLKFKSIIVENYSMAKQHAAPTAVDGKGFLPHIAYDSVVFGFSAGQLKILLMEYHNTGLIALPGGFIRTREDLDDAVRVGLRERTGINNIYLEQFHTFGKTSRHQPEVLRRILQANGIEAPGEHWMLQRFISVAYYALVDFNTVSLQPDALSDSCTWYDVQRLPPLILDHASIISKALETLRLNLDKKVQNSNLLPKKFTMKQLQQVYEAILGEDLRRTSFQRKMLAAGILERHEKLYSGKAHKAPFIYSFSEPAEA